MVLFGFRFQRAFFRALLASIALSCKSTEAAEGVEVAGTLPEDYLPGLKTILANAFNRSPRMVAREYERVIQEARLTMAKSARLPNLGGNFDYGLTQTATASNTSSRSRNTGAQYSFNLGQSVFHWGAIKNEIEISKIGVHLTSKDSARIYQEVALTLRKAYLALIVQKARLLHARDGLQLVKGDVAIAKTRKEDGTISGGVLAGEELRLREAELQVGRSTAEFESSRRSFARVAGLPDLPEEAIPAEIPEPKYEENLVAALTAKTLRENARSTLEWEIFDMKLRQAQLRQKIVNTRLLPKFGIGAGYSLRNNTYVNGPTVNQEAVTEQRFAVSGLWNIFDGFATGGAKREAAAARRALEHRKTVEIEELLQTVQQLERTLKIDAEQLQVADIRHGIARGAEELMAEGVKLGSLAKGNLERGRVNTMQAYATALEARAVFLGRWAELVSTAGEDPVLSNFSDRNAPKK